MLQCQRTVQHCCLARWHKRTSAFTALRSQPGTAQRCTLAPASALPSHRRRAQVTAAAAATLAAATTAAGAGGLLAPQNAAALAQLLTSAGIFVICIAAAVFLLACIPSIWSLGRVAMRAEAVLKVVEQELPESSALMRLSGMEVTDCVAEISSLGADLSSGLRSAANLATMTEQSVRQGVDGAGRVISEGLVPWAAQKEQAARAALEAELVHRAQLKHTQELVRGVGQAAGATVGAVRRVRLGMQVAQLVGAAVTAGSALRQRLNNAAASNLAAAPRPRA